MSVWIIHEIMDSRFRKCVQDTFTYLWLSYVGRAMDNWALRSRDWFFGYALQFFKVAFSTFWFKFGATLRRQAERRDSGTRRKASNLAQTIS